VPDIEELKKVDGYLYLYENEISRRYILCCFCAIPLVVEVRHHAKPGRGDVCGRIY